MFENDFIEKLKVQYNKWKESVFNPHVKIHPEKKKEFSTSSGNSVKCFYSPIDIADMEYGDIGFPGEFPFTRGVSPTRYRSDIWVMGQYSGYGTAVETNQRYKYLIQKGSTGVGIAFDLPTQLGLDSDSPLARYQVGVAGVAVDTLDDMRIILDGIPIETIELRAISNAQAVIILSMIIAIAEERHIDLKQMRMEIMNDVLKEYIARGNYIFPPEKALKLSIDIIEYCLKNIPNAVSCKVCGYHMREAGCNAAQEVAFAMSDAIAHVEEAVKRGLNRNAFPCNFRFYFSCHRNLLEEVAKLRAATRLWGKIMKERFGVTNPEAMKLRLFITSSGSTLTTVEPYNNIVRIAFQALAGVLGGAEVMHLASMDEGHALPTELSAKIALRTQQILAYETGVTDSVDPLGGSYMVEHLTNMIEKDAFAYIKKIDDLGGAVRAIETGYMQKEIAKAAYETQIKIENGEEIVVGVNKFRSEKYEKIERFKIDPNVEKNQKERLRKIKTNRNGDKVNQALLQVKEKSIAGENVIPSIIRAVKLHASIGEICDVLRNVLGIYQQPAM
jgi:methylmalonyl-CoA mutase N-terminal domain/subunit